MDENYQFIADALGEPNARVPFSDEERAFMEGRLPPRLVEFLEVSGHSIYADGGVTLCPPSAFSPILALVFKGDPDLDHRDCTVVSYTAFGDLNCWSKKHGKVTVHLAEGQVSSMALAPTQFAPEMMPKPQGEPDPNVVACGTVVHRVSRMDFLDFKGDEMLDACIAAHGPLELGECYGFFPALGLAGAESPTRRVENIKRVQALEHFALLAQLQPFYLTNIDRGGIQRVREIG